jgi:hypothetical protein
MEMGFACLNNIRTFFGPDMPRSQLEPGILLTQVHKTMRRSGRNVQARLTETMLFSKINSREIEKHKKSIKIKA